MFWSAHHVRCVLAMGARVFIKYCLLLIIQKRTSSEISHFLDNISKSLEMLYIRVLYRPHTFGADSGSARNFTHYINDLQLHQSSFKVVRSHYAERP